MLHLTKKQTFRSEKLNSENYFTNIRMVHGGLLTLCIYLNSGGSSLRANGAKSHYFFHES